MPTLFWKDFVENIIAFQILDFLLDTSSKGSLYFEKTFLAALTQIWTF